MDALRAGLTALLERHRLHDVIHTPAPVLVDYLVECLAAFDRARAAREEWYGRDEWSQRERPQ